MGEELFKGFIKFMHTLHKTPFIEFILGSELSFDRYYTDIIIYVKRENEVVLRLIVDKKSHAQILSQDDYTLGEIHEEWYLIRKNNLPLFISNLIGGNSCDKCTEHFYMWEKNHNTCLTCGKYMCRKHDKECCNTLSN